VKNCSGVLCQFGVVIAYKLRDNFSERVLY